MESETGMEFISRVRASSLCDLGSNLFQGPINPPEIIEVSGAFGTGKSIFCLDLIATTLLPKTLFRVPIGGLESGAILVDCDQHFNIIHFTDMMERRIKRVCHKARAEWKRLGEEKCKEEELMTIKKRDFKNKLDNAIRESLKNLIYLNCADSNQFAVTLMSLEQYIGTKKSISLIAVDSLSSFYWFDKTYKVDSWSKMEAYYNTIFQTFISTIKRHHLICVCTRQDLFRKRKERDEETSFNPFLTNLSKNEEPVAYEYLGKEWSNGVTIRVLITKNHGNNQLQSDVYHTIEIVRGDQTKSCRCTIHEDGIRLDEN